MAELRALVNIHQKAVALQFVDYLRSNKINSKVIAAKDDNGTTDGWTVLVEDANHQLAKAEFEQFIRMPNHPKYQQSAWQSGHGVKLTSNGEFGKQFKANFLAQAGPFSIFIFALCWFVFAATFLLFGDDVYQLVIFNQYGDISQTMAQPWRFITPAIFHYSLLHIAFNTMWWWQLGGQIEKRLGLSTIVLLFLASAIISNSAQYLVSGPGFGGLSGVVYATLGFVWWYQHLNPNQGIGISMPIIGFMLFWLVLGFTEFMPINVANTAHLVGLLSGIGMAFLVTHQMNNKKKNT